LLNIHFLFLLFGTFFQAESLFVLTICAVWVTTAREFVACGM